MKEIFIGVDLSSTSTGVVALDKTGELLFTYAIQPKMKDINLRYLKIKEELFKIVENYGQDMLQLGIESPSFFSKGKTITLAAGWGYIYFSLLEGNYNVFTYPPSKIKKFATNNGRADKQMMYDCLSDNIKLEIDSTTYKKKDDIVDAYWIAKMCYKGVN